MQSKRPERHRRANAISTTPATVAPQVLDEVQIFQNVCYFSGHLWAGSQFGSGVVDIAIGSRFHRLSFWVHDCCPSGVPYQYAQSEVRDASTALNDYSSWQHPFRDRRIYIHPAALRSLSARALHSLKAMQPTEVGGTLYGKMPARPEDPVVIEDAVFAAPEGVLYNATPADARNIVQAMRSRGTRDSLPIVGYFRSHIREGLCLSSQDEALIESEFRDTDAVFLIIKPFEIGICMAGFFFWQDGRVQTDVSELEVPFVALNEPLGQKTVENPVAVNRQPEAGVAGSPETPSVEAIAKPSGSNVPKISAASEPRKWPVWPLLVVTSVLALALVLIGGVAAYLAWPILKSRVQTLSVYTSDPEIGLQVVGEPGGQLNLSWNKNAPQINRAQNARLTINDGLLSRELKLDNTQLHSGKIAYFPSSDDVQFRLEVSLESRRTVSESVRVLSSGAKTANERPSPTIVGRMGIQSAASRRATVVPRAAEGHKLKQPEVPEYLLLAKPEPPSGTQTWKIAPEIPLPTPGSAASLPASLALSLPPAPIVNRAASNTKDSMPVPQSSTAANTASSPAAEADRAATFVPPKPIHQAMPNTRLLGASIFHDATQISVQVSVDRTGRVTAAHALQNGKKSSSLLSSVCVTAARQWVFEPASLNGKNVAADHIIVFDFHPSGR